MKLKVLLTVLIIISVEAYSFAQKLKVGDMFPDYTFTNLLNYEAQSVKSSQLRGKMVILDIWHVRCVACINGFPKAEKLRDKFKDKLEIIAVTWNTKEEIEKLKQHSSITRNTKLPMAHSDTTLYKYFSKLPHHIWIDPFGKIRAITNIYNATETNFVRIMNDPQATLGGINDISVNKEEPLFLEGDKRFIDHLDQFSYLMNYIDGVNEGSGRRLTPDSKEIVRYFNRNTSRLRLIKDAFFSEHYWEHGNSIGVDHRRVIFEVADLSRYIKPENRDEYDDWKINNVFSYELMVSPARAKEFYAIMQKDICRLFDINVRFEKRKVKCLALVRTSANDKLKTAGGNPSIVYPFDFHSVNISKADSIQLLSLRNRDMLTLIRYLLFNSKAIASSPIVIDQTNYTHNIDIDIMAKLLDVQSVREALKKYDLDLVEKEIEIDMLVIKDPHREM